MENAYDLYYLILYIVNNNKKIENDMALILNRFIHENHIKLMSKYFIVKYILFN